MSYGLLISLLFIPLFTTGTDVVAQNTPPLVQKQLTFNERRAKVEKLVLAYSKQYRVNSEEIMDVIECESAFRVRSVGDGGQSRGLVQIHKPSHPTITDEQAFDPEFSVHFIVSEFAKDNQ